MLKIIALFALLTLLAAAFAFGWLGGEKSEFGTILFWICTVVLAGLLARAALGSR